MPNNWKCRLSISCQVDTQAHSVVPTFTRCQVEANFNMPSSLLVRKLRSPASDEGCRIDIATHLAAINICILLRPSLLHCSCQEGGDFLASQMDASDKLHDAVCLSVGSSLENLVNSRGLEVDNNLVKNQVYRLLQQQIPLYPLPLFTQAEC